jgi:beta-phosphoglucomutase
MATGARGRSSVYSPFQDSVLKATLFDFNGVLVDDEHLHLACFNEVLAARAIVVSDEVYAARYLGFDDAGAFSAILRDHDRPTRPEDIAALIEEKALVYARRAARELRVFEGAAAAVRAAATEGRVVVVSGALRAEIELGLAALGVRALVEHIVSAEDVLRCKPDPEGYLLALGWLRAQAPSLDRGAVRIIEDSLAGVDAGVSAGVSVWAVAQSYPAQALRERGAARVFDTIAAAADAIGTG